MFRYCRFWTYAVFATAVPPTFLAVALHAQVPERLAASGDQAYVVVEGNVKQVFRNLQPSEPAYLVQMSVLRSEVQRALPPGATVQVPAPGQLLYVQMSDPDSRRSQLAFPSPQQRILARLVPAADGGWAGTFPDLPVGRGTVPAEADPGDIGGSAMGPASTRAPGSLLGMTTELVEVGGHTALKVTSTQRGGAAQQAGLEDGDLIVAVNGKPLSSLQQLEDAQRLGKPFSIAVADVRTRRVVQVDVDPAKRVGAAAAGPRSEIPGASRASLGISAESVSLGIRTALKVTRVEPGTAAALAGIEPGDIIVEANGAQVTGPEQLVSAVKKSGPQLELVVRDSRTGRNTPVQVKLGGAEPTTNWPPASSTPRSDGTGSDLGVVTELAFHNDEFAVKVTEIESGSPAARAGIRPGMLVLKVNDKPVLHPKELDDAIRQSGRTATLQVVDPSTGRTSNLDVAL